jgi:iron(III) transport system permease protein
MIKKLPEIAVLKQKNTWWYLASLLFLLIVLVPFIFLGLTVFSEQSKFWEHIAENLLKNYSYNTFSLLLLSAIFSILLAVPQAWLVSNFKFPLRRILNLGLVLPLTIPGYIMAFTYSGILDYTGWYGVTLRKLLGAEGAKSFYFDEKNLVFLALLLSFSLFPYVFISARIAFRLNAASFIEASKLLGLSKVNRFFKVVLPLARPAIAGGLFLVFMEILNDYGAAKYYGITTFTTGIFKAWFDFGDLAAAGYLSAILVVIVAVFMAVEKYFQGAIKVENSARNKPVMPEPLKGIKSLIALTICLIPFLLGFLLPFSQLLVWFIKNASYLFEQQFIKMVLNSAFLAGLSAIIILLFSIVILYAARVNKAGNFDPITRAASVGYAIPGAVIAIGAMASATFSQGFFSLFNIFLSGSVLLLILSYNSRFIAVGLNPLEDAFNKNSFSIHQAARLNGMGTLKTLFKIELPILKNAIASAAILVFIDVLKELPLTLILRPFNFDTLATKAFELANDELISQAAVPSILIIFAGFLPVFYLNKIAK